MSIEQAAPFCTALLSLLMPPRRRPVEASRSVGGAENWNDLQTVALSKAWYYVSANLVGPSSGQMRDGFVESVMVGCNFLYKQIGGVVRTTLLPPGSAIRPDHSREDFSVFYAYKTQHFTPCTMHIVRIRVA